MEMTDAPALKAVTAKIRTGSEPTEDEFMAATEEAIMFVVSFANSFSRMADAAERASRAFEFSVGASES